VADRLAKEVSSYNYFTFNGKLASLSIYYFLALSFLGFRNYSKTTNFKCETIFSDNFNS